MKLLIPAGLESLSRIRVRDRRGNVWEVTPADTQQRTIRYSNGWGEFEEVRLSAQVPAEHGSEILVVPPVDEWQEGVVYDGVLKHPEGSNIWWERD